MKRSSKLYRLISLATTNATVVLAAQAQLFGGMISNTSAGVRYLKLYDTATAPVVGTTTPVFTILLPAGTTTPLLFADSLFFANGLSFALTGGPTDADTTAVALNDVIVNLFYGVGTT